MIYSSQYTKHYYTKSCRTAQCYTTVNTQKTKSVTQYIRSRSRRHVSKTAYMIMYRLCRMFTDVPFVTVTKLYDNIKLC